MIYLDVEDLLHIAEETLGIVEVRDLGLLEAAAARPQASAFGEDAYRTIYEKAAALIHSTARNHALADGNKRLALAGGATFFWINGLRLTLTNDGAYEIVVGIASGQLDDIEPIAETLRGRTEPRPPSRLEADDGL